MIDIIISVKREQNDIKTRQNDDMETACLAVNNKLNHKM